MKILIVSHLYYPARGGVETHLTRLGSHLVERGHQVKVLTTSALSTEAFFLGDKRRVSLLEENYRGVEITRLGWQTFGRRTLNLLRALACRVKYPFNHWIRLLSYGPRNPLFVDLIIKNNPEVIIAAPLPMMTVYYAWKAARKANIPLIINPAYHINDPCSFNNPLFFKIMDDADLVAVHTQTEKDFLANTGNISSHKIHVFPPLPFTREDLNKPKLPLSKYRLRQKFGIKGKYVVLFVGQHGRHKNIDLILKAMPHIWKIEPETTLVIAGGTTAFTPHLKQLAASLATSSGPNWLPNIKFLDNFPSKQKDEIFSLADIFISLSEFESFGIVFAEAMLYRLPVIGSIFSIARSIVDDFQTGLLINPHCEMEVAGAILELLEDENLRKIYGQTGYEKVVREFSPEIIIKKWEETLQQLLEKN